MENTKSKNIEDRVRILFNAVRANQPISRVKLNLITNIRLATITELVKSLKGDNLIIEEGRKDSLRGRKQSLLKINGERYFALGLEFDADKITAILIDLNSRLKKTSALEIGENKSKEAIIEKIVSVTSALCAGIPAEKLLGLGIADPGVVNSKAGISLFSSLIPGWENVPLGKILEARLKIPVKLIPAPKAKTLAEYRMGRGKGIEHLLFVEFGLGIACGVISEGRLLRGYNEMAGELGHTHVTENGNMCGCGSYGCLEAIAAMPAIVKKIKKSIEAGSESLIRYSEGEAITALQIFEAAENGDKLSLNILNDTAHYLGLAIANAINLFNPEMVIFDQKIEACGEFFLAEIKRVIKRQALRFATTSLKFAVSVLGDKAGPSGAASLILDDFFEQTP